MRASVLGFKGEHGRDWKPRPRARRVCACPGQEDRFDCPSERALYGSATSDPSWAQVWPTRSQRPQPREPFAAEQRSGVRGAFTASGEAGLALSGAEPSRFPSPTSRRNGGVGRGGVRTRRGDVSSVWVLMQMRLRPFSADRPFPLRVLKVHPGSGCAVCVVHCPATREDRRGCVLGYVWAFCLPVFKAVLYLSLPGCRPGTQGTMCLL